MNTFLTTPLKKGKILQCKIIRNKKGLSNKLYPSYHMFLENDKYLLSCKKESWNNTSNYRISMDPKCFDKKSSSFLGKVRSNFIGTVFHVYDNGKNPKKCKTMTEVRK